MKKLSFSLLGLVLIFGIFSFIRSQNKPIIETPSLQSEAPHTPPKNALTESQRKTYDEPRKIDIAASQAVSPECQRYWKSLEELNLSSLISEKKIALIPKASGCIAPAALSQKQTEVELACKLLTEGTVKEANPVYATAQNACLSSLFQYRAAVTHFLTQDQTANQITDPRILLDKMLATLGENATQSAEFAERLLELDPTFYPAAKASLTGRLLSAQLDAEKEGGAGVWNKYDDALSRAQKLNPSDPELLEASLIKEVAGKTDFSRLKKEAEEMSLRHPESGTGPYYQAAALYKSGDRQGAEAMLAEALRREPGNTRYKETLAGMKGGTEKPFIFTLSYSVMDYPGSTAK